MVGGMRTFTRADLDASREAWAALKLSPRWEPIRRRAADAGMPYPPTGTRWDQWDDPMPSQFALVARAVNDGWTARLLEVIGQSRSWSDVVRRLLADRDARSEEVALRDRDREWARRDADPREATVSLRRIMERIGNS